MMIIITITTTTTIIIIYNNNKDYEDEQWKFNFRPQFPFRITEQNQLFTRNETAKKSEKMVSARL